MFEVGKIYDTQDTGYTCRVIAIHNDVIFSEALLNDGKVHFIFMHDKNGQMLANSGKGDIAKALAGRDRYKLIRGLQLSEFQIQIIHANGLIDSFCQAETAMTATHNIMAAKLIQIRHDYKVISYTPDEFKSTKYYKALV